jgi:hypothetical protein
VSAKYRLFPLILIAGTAATISAQAAEAPNYLRGKSFELNWSRSMTYKLLEGQRAGQEVTKVESLSANVYVSDKGRVFSSFRNTDNSVTNDVQGVGQNAMFWKYDGGAIVGDQIFLKGMRRIKVSSRDEFKTCALDIIFGRLNGNQPLVVKGSRSGDVAAEIADVQFLAKTCQVMEGNVFNGESR